MEQHIVKGFDRDLDKIKDHINKISGLVESQLAYAYQSLNERDILIAEKVIERDKNCLFNTKPPQPHRPRVRMPGGR